jgi:hypothetical protein
MKTNDHKRRLCLRDVRELYEIHGARARDQASELLGGDPFQASEVAQRVFRKMLGMQIEHVAPAEKLPAWIADQVVRFCLEQTGNHTVADWQAYLETHPESRAKKARVRSRTRLPEERPARSNVIELRPRRVDDLRATRKARETLEARRVSHEQRAATSEADAPDAPHCS